MPRPILIAALLAVFTTNTGTAMGGFDLPRLMWPNEDAPVPVTRDLRK